MTNWQIIFRAFTVTLVCYGTCTASIQASPPPYLSNTSYQIVPEQERLIQAPQQRAVLDLCGTWQTGSPGAPPDGEIWIPGCYTDEDVREFHRTFTLGPEFTGKHLSLIAEGINYRATIRVNGRIIGTATSFW